MLPCHRTLQRPRRVSRTTSWSAAEVGRSPGHEREPSAALCGRLALPAEGDCLPESPGLGWAFTPGADCDARTRSLAADIRKGKRAGGVVHGASGVGLMMVMPLPGC